MVLVFFLQDMVSNKTSLKSEITVTGNAKRKKKAKKHLRSYFTYCACFISRIIFILKPQLKFLMNDEEL